MPHSPIAQKRVHFWDWSSQVGTAWDESEGSPKGSDWSSSATPSYNFETKLKKYYHRIL